MKWFQDPRLVTSGLLGLLAGCAGFDAEAPDPIGRMADRLVEKDVVFLGEQHDHDALHEQHMRLVRELHARRPNLAISMEMFSRDAQDVIDAYLADGISEESFLEESNPWPNYTEHYRPFVEFCRENGLALVAANLPRSLVSKVTMGGVEAVQDDPMFPREYDATKGPGYDAFAEVMRGMGGHAADNVDAYWPAQVAWDETMAESIADHLASVEGEAPLVVHIVGAFHVKGRYGTVEKLLRRRPDLDVGVVGVEIRDTVAAGGEDGEDFRFLVPEQPASAPAVEPPTQSGGEEDVPETEEEPEYPAGARPALGFRPSYDDGGDGVHVESLRPEGPAELGGMKAGDVIIELAGQPIEVFDDYNEVLNTLVPGKKVEVKVNRKGEEGPKTLSIRVGARID